MLNDDKINELCRSFNMGSEFAGFLRHIRDRVLPAEESELSRSNAPRTAGLFYSSVLRLEDRDKEALDRLLDAFVQREFCALVSSYGYYTLWGSKHLLYGPFRAGRTRVVDEVQVVDPEDYVLLPDMVIFNEQWLGWCSVRHQSPEDRSPHIKVPLAQWKCHWKMADLYPWSPVLYCIHNYGPNVAQWQSNWSAARGLEERSRRKWDVHCRPEDWMAVELATVEDTNRDDDGMCVDLRDFVPLRDLLDQMDARAEDAAAEVITGANVCTSVNTSTRASAQKRSNQVRVMLERLKDLGVTQADIAREVGVCSSAVYLWRTGRGNPREENVEKVRRLLEDIESALRQA